MRIYLLRHGETDFNAQRRYLGWTDAPLSQRGCSELVKADFSPQVVYTSGLLRTGQTAGILFPEARQVPVPDLKEMDFGVFEGRNYQEMEDLPAYRTWVEGGCLGRIPEGESKEGFCKRTCAAFAALADQMADTEERILTIVAHGGTQMAVLERYARPAGDYFSWNAPCGGGYLLDASRWSAERVLTVLDRVKYTRGGASWS